MNFGLELKRFFGIQQYFGRGLDSDAWQGFFRTSNMNTKHTFVIDDDDFWEKAADSCDKVEKSSNSMPPGKPTRPLPSFLSNRSTASNASPRPDYKSHASRPIPAFFSSAQSKKRSRSTASSNSNPYNRPSKEPRINGTVNVKMQLCVHPSDKTRVGFWVKSNYPKVVYDRTLNINGAEMLTEHGKDVGVWVPHNRSALLDGAISLVIDKVRKQGHDVKRLEMSQVTRKYLSSKGYTAPEYEFEDLSSLDRLPVDLKNTLFEFQKHGVQFAINKDGRCMIGDEMGLGKTLQAIAVARYYIDDWPLLVICPSSLRLSWKHEITKWLPSLHDEHVNVVLKGSDKLMGKNSRLTRVVIISYDLVPKKQKEIESVDFQCCVLDESHYIKSYTAKRTKAVLPLLKKSRRVLLLSGTPALSRPIELYTQITALVPKMFGNWKEFGIRYCKGFHGRWGWEFKGADNLKELNYLLTRFVMIRRLKKDVLSQLKPKTRTAIMVKCGGSRKLSSLAKKVTKLRSILQCLTSSGDLGDGSVIKKLSMKVGDSEHKAVIQMYKETGVAKVKAVWQYVDDLLEGGAKLLLFAHHKEVLDALEDSLKKKGTFYFRLDGKTPPRKRQEGVQCFQEQESCRVGLISITAGGIGLTLTAANKVVFAELCWTPALLQQAEDRAHRIGQQDSVDVSYVIAVDTLDQKLWPMVQKKLEVLGETLGGSKSTMSFEAVQDRSNSVGNIGQRMMGNKKNGIMAKKVLEVGEESPSSDEPEFDF